MGQCGVERVVATWCSDNGLGTLVSKGDRACSWGLGTVLLWFLGLLLGDGQLPSGAGQGVTCGPHM